MRGVFSPSPSQSAIRALVGTHLLLLVQATLVLTSGVQLDWQLEYIVAGAALLGLTGIITAIHGGDAHDSVVWRPRRFSSRTRRPQS